MTHPLAVLTPEVGVLTETFVEWDCNHLLPGRTAVAADPPPRGETVLHGPSWTADGPTLSFHPLAGDPEPSPERCDALARFLRAHGVEVLLVQYLDLAVRWFDTLRRLPIPVWVRGHGADLSARLQPTYSRLAGLAGIIVPTRAAADRLVPDFLPAELVHVVPNHVDVPSLPPRLSPSRTPHDVTTVRCLTVGRLVAKKGHVDLLHAFRSARRHHPHLTLDIVGDGPLRPRLTSLVRELDLVASVRLLGARSAGEVLARTVHTDIYLQPSATGPDGDSEGQPLALLQAMAAARPCIVTRHQGIAETLTDGHSAALVDEHDVEQLAETLAELAEHPDQRSRLGLAAWHVAATTHAHTVARPRLHRLLGLVDHA